jgi:succinoglycan biosynthesis protein ExoM
VALVDDDETVEPGWLDRLLSAQRRSRADAVTGPVLTRFEVEPPPWFRAGGFLTYPRYADGESRPIAYTNNVLVRARCLEALGALFDETMTFGTDSELFARFTDRGYRIVWADDARVEESVPSDRIRLGYLLRRSLREGLALVRLERRLERRGLGGVALRGLARLVEGIAGAVVPLPRCLAARAESLRTAAYGLGRLVGLAEWLASVDRGPATISPDA